MHTSTAASHSFEEEHRERKRERMRDGEMQGSGGTGSRKGEKEASRSAISNRARRGFCSLLFTVLLLAAIAALVVWLVYRPHKPKFMVVSAAVYDLNATAPPLLSTTMQFTVITRNSNKRVSFLYDHFSSFLSYRNQAITPPAVLPPLYHETKSTVALSPVLGGSVPVSPEVSNGLGMDEAYGAVPLRLVLTGRVKYKAGAIRTRRYWINVECDMLVGLKKGFTGQVPLLGSPLDCKVHV